MLEFMRSAHQTVGRILQDCQVSVLYKLMISRML